MYYMAIDSMQVVRRRSFARLRKRVAARAFVAKPGFLACLQRSASIACKMQASIARTNSCLLKKLNSQKLDCCCKPWPVDRDQATAYCI